MACRWERANARRGCRAALAAALLLALAVLPTPAQAAPAPVIPLGASVWWGCMKEVQSGPPILNCPRPYDPRYAQTVDPANGPYEVYAPENELKMPWVNPAEGRYDFSVVDEMLRYAQAHGAHVRGHTLVFGSTLPAWMTAPSRVNQWTRATLSGAIREYIITVMRHVRDNFPGVVREWDVVNEAYDDNGKLSRNLLSRVIGPDYVELAFRWAHEADPDALLYYNDFNADEPNPRQRAILAMAKDFLARGVPIDGVGLQMHLGMVAAVPSEEERLQVMRGYADLGLRVAITELDIGLPPPLGVGTQEAQQVLYEQIARDCSGLPACTGVTVWGVSDALSWRGLLAAPLLIDGQYRPKLALAKVQAILARAPARAPLLAGTPNLLAPIPVLDARRGQPAATLARDGLRVQADCPGTPPCTIDFTLTLRGNRLATRSVVIPVDGHITRLRMSDMGVRHLAKVRSKQRARLRARVQPGPWVALPIDVTVLPKGAAAKAAKRRTPR